MSLPPATHCSTPSPSPSLRARRLSWLVAIGLGVTLLLPAASHAQRVTSYGLQYNVPAMLEQHLAISNKTGLENPDYTIEAWVWPETYTNYPCIMGNDFTSSFWLGLNPSGRVRFYPTGGAGNYVESADVVPLDAWTHVAVTYSTVSGWAIYLDGTLNSSGGAMGVPGTSADSLRIGADHPLGGSLTYFWQGKLGDIRLWNRALGASDIHDNMFTGPGANNFQGPRYAGLVGYWFSNFLDSYPSLTGLNDQARAPEAGAPTSDQNTAWVAGLYEDMFGGVTLHVAVPHDYNVGLEMNGTDDYTSMDDHDGGYAGGLTIEAWVCPYSFDNFPAIVGRDFTSSFWLGISPDGHLRFYPRGGIILYLDGSIPIPPNRWTHVAATYDPVNGVSRTWVNGVLDIDSEAITGPIGENGRDLYIGADNEVAGPAYRFHGILDEVCVTDGPLPEDQIRLRRFYGTDPFVGPSLDTEPDVHGVTRRTFRAHFGPYHYQEVTAPTAWSPLIHTYGSHAKLVVSGAPMFGVFALNSFDESQFVMAPPGGVGLTVPDQFELSSLDLPITIPDAGSITDVDVFLSLSCDDLGDLTASVESPSGTDVELLPAGVLEGRSLQTVFDDESAYALADRIGPEEYGCQPANPLSAFDGEHRYGDWTLHLSSSGPAKFAVWGAGIHTEIATDAVDDGLPGGIRFVNAGAEPVRGRGTVLFALPRAADVSLSLYDAAGRRVRMLQKGPRAAGEHRFTWTTAGLAPGRYVMTLDVRGEARRTLKVTVVR